MVSDCVLPKCATKLFFVNPPEVKVNSKYYRSHLNGTLLLACDLLSPVEKLLFCIGWSDLPYRRCYRSVPEEEV